jgi:hypothetical protein
LGHSTDFTVSSETFHPHQKQQGTFLDFATQKWPFFNLLSSADSHGLILSCFQSIIAFCLLVKILEKLILKNRAPSRKIPTMLRIR